MRLVQQCRISKNHQNSEQILKNIQILAHFSRRIVSFDLSMAKWGLMETLGLVVDCLAGLKSSDNVQRCQNIEKLAFYSNFSTQSSNNSKYWAFYA